MLIGRTYDIFAQGTYPSLLQSPRTDRSWSNKPKFSGPINPKMTQLTLEIM